MSEAAKKMDGIKACVFDAYGTLFDVHSAVGRHRERLGSVADPVSAMWRTKQLEYTWLRSLMGAYEDFWQVTADALDYALETHKIEDESLRNDLLQAYLQLEAYAEVPATLKRLKDSGISCSILTNGSPDMIKSAVDSAGLADVIDHSFSVQSVGIFKPDARVYQLAVDGLGVSAGEISFQSSNSWDAVGAAHFGFHVAWINRFGQRRERLPAQPEVELADLNGLPQVVGAA